MNIRPLGLLLPAVLAGCVSHSANKDTPAYIYVDGLIADSAQTISHTQSALNQTGPYPVRPISPVNTIKPLSPTVPRKAEQLTRHEAPVQQLQDNHQPAGLSNVIYSGRPGPLQFPQRAGNVRGITVEAAAKRIVPGGWSVSWAPGLAKVRRQRITLSLNDQWPRVLNNLMAAKSLNATVEWSQSRVTVTPVSSAQTHLFSSQ